jgi:N-acetylglucosaminyldiphosphoundecaprenol N-acetyl-beta-D-mannosaminyltransferase
MPRRPSNLSVLPAQNQQSRDANVKFSPPRNINILSRRITFMTSSEIVSETLLACEQKKRLVVACWNVHAFNLSFHMPWFYAFMNSADISYCDGSGILLAAKYFGHNIPASYRVAGGTDLVPDLLMHADKLSFFLLGAKPANLSAAIERLQAKYPGIKISGHHGYFDKADPVQNAQIIRQINQFKPNVLIVGMGMPVQEKWIAQYKDQLQVNAILPCGAVIDRLAGDVVDCPRWISHLGAEWVFRLCQEPKRLAKRYLVGNFAFALQLILGKKFFEQPITPFDEKALTLEAQRKK